MNNSTQKGYSSILLPIIIIIIALGGLYLVMTTRPTENVQEDIENTATTTRTQITLITPNGDETVKIGESINLEFTVSGDINETHKVIVWLDEGAYEIARIPASETSYRLVIPEQVLVGGDAISLLQPGNYKIRVSLYDGDPCVGFCVPTPEITELSSDSSDGEITITN